MVILLFSVIFSIGYILGFPPFIAMAIGLPIALFYVLVTYSFSVQSVIAAAKARPANPQKREEKILIYKVEEMAIAAGLPAHLLLGENQRKQLSVQQLAPSKNLVRKNLKVLSVMR